MDLEAIHTQGPQVQRLLSLVQDCTLTVPSELTRYYLHKGGAGCKDPLLVKLAALAAQHFIDTLVHDTYQANRRRQATEAQASGKKTSSKAPALQTVDLAAALQEFGIGLGHQEFYREQPAGAH